MKNKKTNTLLFFAALLLTLSACMPERKLAREFIASPQKINIQVFAPEAILKYNHKGEKIKGFNIMTDAQQDSALYASSQFIGLVDDSAYLERYVNLFIDELRKLGFEVYLENSVDTFLYSQPQAYVISMAQVQLDEYTLPVEDSLPVGDSMFYKRFDLNAVDASTWFEVSKLNVTKPKKTILFSTLTASDAFNGNFFIDPNSMDVRYKYSVDSLTVNDLYDLAAYSGRQQADYLFDYFMNSYIGFHMPEGILPNGYYRYNRSNGSLSTTEEERFEVLDSK